MDPERKRSIRLTAALLALAMGIWSTFHFSSVAGRAAAGAAVVLLSVAIGRPSLLGPAFDLWVRAGRLLGKVNTTVLLALVFYLVLTPVRLLLELAGKDPLKRKRGGLGTYWEEYRLSGPGDGSRYERQF